MRTKERPQRTPDRPEPTADADVYVLGGGPLGETVARRLGDAGRAVVLVDDSAETADVGVVRADPTDATALIEAGVDDRSVVVVATPSDGRNLLVAQLVRARFDVERIVVLTNHPDRVEAMADVGHEPVCATAVLADGLVDRL